MQWTFRGKDGPAPERIVLNKPTSDDQWMQPDILGLCDIPIDTTLTKKGTDFSAV